MKIEVNTNLINILLIVWSLSYVAPKDLKLIKVIYRTNIDDTSVFTSGDTKLLAASVKNQLGLNDANIWTHQFASVNGNLDGEGTPKEITSELFIIELSLSHNSNIENISKYKQIQLSLMLENEQTMDIKMDFVSFNQIPSSHETSSGPCQGGLYPNDEKCVAYQYGPDPIQVIDCHLPKGAHVDLVVLLIHGGFWRSKLNRSLENAVANDLLRFNIVVCNLDYRSFGNDGGYPNTFYDVSNGTDLIRLIAREHGFRSDRVIVVGHSAGGQLGGYVTGRFRLAPNQPGYSIDPLRPIALVTQAGVNNMWDGCDQANVTGVGAVISFLGGNYTTYPERYVLSSLAASSNVTVESMYPSQFLPLKVPIQAITGSADITVPVSQTITFAEQAKSAGDNCTQVIVEGEDHFVHLNVSSTAWEKTRAFILSFIP
ncbi:unnamed protein product [Adineta ricciae]|uniref:BD-FAE-like domain-containing protein n=1 Tax=Adineta ricciae TaxID=249248 RepID=A0A815ZWJ8_ADIRI|nr:unnamed protein product [Adineta ricciae]